MPGGVPGGRPARVRALDCFWVAILEPSGRFWWPFGSRLGAEGVARMAPFRPLSGQNTEERGSGRPFVAEPGRGRTLGAEWVPPEAAAEAYRLILPSKYEVPAGPDFPCFLVPERHEKSIKSGTFGARAPIFPVFGRLLGRSEFALIFDAFPAGPRWRKIPKNAARGVEK